jgi:Protein of unknown function (DUF1826)
VNAATVPVEHLAGDRHRLVWSEQQLGLIRGRTVDLCVWRRGVDAQLAEWCQAIARTHPLQVDGEFALDALPLDALLGSLPPGPARQSLRDDIAERAHAYARIIGSGRVRLQLHSVQHQHCPRFHVDSVGVRLITTYAGPATEWLAETDLVRARIGKGSTAEVPARPSAQPRRLARFDVALLKGSAWRGNSHFGVVHRSPPIDGQPRLVLLLDARRE